MAASVIEREKTAEYGVPVSEDYAVIQFTEDDPASLTVSADALSITTE